MLYKEIKNDRRYFWTNHSKKKLVQYNLGPNAVKRVIRSPERTQKGIAPNTLAVMKDRSTKKQKKELWVMYQQEVKNQKSSVCQQAGKNKLINLNKFLTGRIKIISAWIYPGKTKKDEKIFIPEDVMEELQNFFES